MDQSENLSRKKKKYNRILIIAIIAMIGVMVLSGGILFRSVYRALGNFASEQISLEARSTAQMFSRVAMTKVERLQYIGKIIQGDTSKINAVLSSIQGTDESSAYGLVTMDNTPVFGEKMDDEELLHAKEAFSGGNVLSYIKGRGMLSAVPVKEGSSLKYVFYQLIPPELFATVANFDNAPLLKKSVLIDPDGEVVFSFKGVTKEDVDFLSSSEIKDYFAEMQEDFSKNNAACALRLTKTPYGSCFLYEASIPDTDYVLRGFMTESEGAASLLKIIYLIMGIFTFLEIFCFLAVIFLIMTHRNIMRVDEVVRENARAESESMTKSSFLASMSHEIRTPVNAVLGINEMILREFDDPKLTGYATNIKDAGNTLLNVINDVLDYSKMESGKLSIVPVDYDLSEMINEIYMMIRTRAAEKNLDLIIDVDETMPHMLNGDSLRVKQCALNILTNAVKYTKRGKVVFSVTYQQLPDGSGNYTFSVQDTGIGIKQEDMERLFIPFERIDEVKNHGIEGTGLGLSITQRLLKIMDSSLKVSSVYGEGSTFSFTVRQFVLDPEPIGNFRKSFEEKIENAPLYHQSFTAPDAKLLVIDDTDMNLFVVSGLLKETKIKVDTASSGEQGLAMLKLDTYDLIMIDHKMPVMDGIEVLHRLRRDSSNPNQHRPCIALTANAMSGAREFYLKEGFEDYLSKPIDSAALEKMVREILPKDKIILESEPEIPDPDLAKAVAALRSRQDHFVRM